MTDPANWTMACASNACVEVASEGGRVFMRATALPARDKWLDLDREEWSDFLAAAKAGGFDHI
jgi:hypothetical protein